MKSSETAIKSYDTVQSTGVQEAADHEPWRMWSCWWPHVQSVRKVYHRHISQYLKFQGILKLSVIN